MSDVSVDQPDEGIARMDNMEQFNTFEQKLHESGVYNVVVSYFIFSIPQR